MGHTHKGHHYPMQFLYKHGPRLMQSPLKQGTYHCTLVKCAGLNSNVQSLLKQDTRAYALCTLVKCVR